MWSSTGRWVSVVALGMALGALGCGEGGMGGAVGDEPRAGAPQLSDVPQSGEARVLLEELRARHQVLMPALPRDPLSARLPAARARQWRPLLGPAANVRFSPEATQLRAGWVAPAAADLDLRLPLQSTAPFHLADRASGVAIEARLLDARSAPAEVDGGYVVYRAGGPSGGQIIHRVTESGTEDYIAFDVRPAEDEIRYDVALSSEVAGLRLVDDTLEFLDAASTPRLRVSPPFIAGADGQTRSASLSISGCAADRDPSPPWDRAVTPPGAARCELRIRWDGDAVAYPAIVDPSWSTTASMGAARTRFIAAAFSSTRVLVSGGWTNNQSAPLASAEVYNSSSRSWSATASMGTARAEHAAAVRGNGSVLVTGGTNGTVALSSAGSWSPSTGRWTPHGAMSAARTQHQATALANGDVLITGGTVNGSLGAQRFVNSSATWSNAGTMLSFHATHSATLLADGRVLSVGGEAPASQLFDPAANSWTATPSPGTPRTGHAAVRLADGKVMVTGGFGSLFSSVEIFDPASGAWSKTGNLWQSHALHTATRLNDGRVLVFGNFAGDNHTAAEIYDPTWGTWRPGPVTATLSLRDQHVAALLGNGRVLIAGGTAAAASGALSTAMELVPTTTATVATEYKSGTGGLPAPAVDPDVLSDRVTELWAVVHRPNPMPSGRLPLLIFLHGNHNTCGHGANPRLDDNIQYTTDGTCPTMPPSKFVYVPTPSHRGYDYVASELASRGYLVVSINANRGINKGASFPGDDDLITARGNLILKHLQRLSEWNRGVSATPSTIGVSLANKLDLTQVALMGHSRGGEGARVAYNLYRQAGSPWPGRIVSPVTFRGILEIAPTDHVGQPFNATNTKWAVVLPMCDGDVDDLSGVRPFDRMMGLIESNVSFKSTYTVWGANHNYFNTEWQQTDAFQCIDHLPIFPVDATASGSAEQRQTGLQAMLSFFTANVGSAADSWFNNTFNPEYSVGFEPQVDRGYTPGLDTAQSRMLEDFLGATGTSSNGVPNIHSNVTVTHGSLPEHAAALRGGDISWSSSGAPPVPFFQINFTNAGTGLNLTSYQLLDMRIDRAFDALNGSEPTDFAVQLVQSDDTLTQAISIDSYVDLLGPVGSYAGIRHSMLQTVRIPFGHFGLANLAAIRGVRFTFSTTTSGRIYVANIRATRTSVVGSSLAAAQLAAPAAAAETTAATVAPRARPFRNPVTPGAGAGGQVTPRQITSGNTVVALRTAPDGSIDFELTTTTPFLTRDARFVLRVGGAETSFNVSTTADLTRVIFRMDRKAFDALAGGEPITVGYDRLPSDIQWDFGLLDKKRLTP